MWRDSLQNIPSIEYCLVVIRGVGPCPGPPACFVVASSGGISEGHGHDGPGVCLGDGQTETTSVPSQGGRGDALLRSMTLYFSSSTFQSQNKINENAKARLFERFNLLMQAAPRIGYIRRNDRKKLSGRDRTERKRVWFHRYSVKAEQCLSVDMALPDPYFHFCLSVCLYIPDFAASTAQMFTKISMLCPWETVFITRKVLSFGSFFFRSVTFFILTAIF